MISIIIPTLNEEDYIRCILDCYLRQTCKDFELIVVDGESEDSTQKIVRQFSKKYKKIRLVVSNKRNVSYQRNLGAKHAKSERLLFNDADISVEKDFLEKALKELDQRNLKVAGCCLTIKSGNAIDKFGYAVLNGWFFLMQYIYPHMVGQCIFSTKGMHNKLHGFDSTIKFAEDNDYVNRSRKFTRFRVLNTVRVQASTRRFKDENRFFLLLKYALCPFYRLLFGEIRSNLFNYKMNIFHKKE
ncbi:glycosyltransferase [Candidatus Woesearchaeota archaeon]|nr:glycosyltransferase [Candidatus Woesearchaeota archaeon]